MKISNEVLWLLGGVALGGAVASVAWYLLARRNAQSQLAAATQAQQLQMANVTPTITPARTAYSDTTPPPGGTVPGLIT